MKRVAVSLLIGCTVSGVCALAQNHAAVAIKDARVVTVSGEELPKATVVIRNGLITDVGTGVSVPGDAWVIDGNGLTVYPGFIDALSSWGIPVPATGRGGAGGATPATTAAEPRAKGPRGWAANFLL